jgi:hypothetical protein
MAEYTATLPDGLTLPPGHKIDETDPRYRALVEAAKSEGLSQRAFSKILGLEAARVNADYAKAAKPAPASSQAAIPAPPTSLACRRARNSTTRCSARPRRGNNRNDRYHSRLPSRPSNGRCHRAQSARHRGDASRAAPAFGMEPAPRHLCSAADASARARHAPRRPQSAGRRGPCVPPPDERRPVATIPRSLASPTDQAAIDRSAKRPPTLDHAGERAKAALAADPTRSNRVIAAAVGVHHSTVAVARNATGGFPTVERTVGLDGRERPARREPEPPPPVAVDPNWCHRGGRFWFSPRNGRRFRFLLRPTVGRR